MTNLEFKTWREIMNYTQVEAGNVLGVSRFRIISWESGKVSVPRYIELACLALFHRLDLSALMLQIPTKK